MISGWGDTALSLYVDRDDDDDQLFNVLLDVDVDC